MEKEGCIEFLKHHNLTVDVLVTDRHKQINKWLQETHPDIKHYFDTWHVAKGIISQFCTFEIITVVEYIQVFERN